MFHATLTSSFVHFFIQSESQTQTTAGIIVNAGFKIFWNTVWGHLRRSLVQFGIKSKRRKRIDDDNVLTENWSENECEAATSL